jgi:DNA-binding transcriptional MocR family regulator
MYSDQTIKIGGSGMAKRAAEVPAWVVLDPFSGTPYYRQLYEGVRAEILSGRLPVGEDDPEASRRAAERGVGAPPVPLYGTPHEGRGGLMLGYAAVGGAGIRQGVRRLAEALE